MMGFGSGVAQVRNAGTRYHVLSMAVKAVPHVDDIAFVDGSRRGVHVNRGRRRSLMPERRNVESRPSAEREGKDAAKARLDQAAAPEIVYSSGAAPANHERDVL